MAGKEPPGDVVAGWATVAGNADDGDGWAAGGAAAEKVDAGGWLAAGVIGWSGGSDAGDAGG